MTDNLTGPWSLTVEFGAEGVEAFTAIEFAAKRRVLQEAGIDLLTPKVKAFVAEPDNPEALDDLTDLLSVLYVDSYLADGGDRRARTAAYLASLRTVFARTTGDTDVKTLATWLSVATLNAAGMQAASDDVNPVLLRWNTMHDKDVRPAHAAADRQRRAPGSPFLVAGERLRYPGDPRGSLENTLNCRCMVQPVSVHPEAASLRAAAESPHDGAVIVALPADDDPIREVGEEEKHLTLCWLGDSSETIADHDAMAEQLAIATEGMRPFTVGITETGELGDDGAWVAFLEKDAPTAVRDALMANDAIAEAVNGVKQHPGYIPHTTLSYESQPEVSGAVTFDRLALWWGEQRDEFLLTEDSLEENPMPLETPLAWHGVLAPEGVWSGDGRRFALDSLRNRDLPLPLTWQRASGEGHNGSTVVARIDSIERVPGDEGTSLMRAEGIWIDTPETDEIVGLVAEFGKFGVSVDADDSEFEFDEDSGEVTFTSARIASASLVSIPAFAEAYISLGTWADTEAMPPETVPSEDVECDPDAPDYEECLAKKEANDPRWEKVDPDPGADANAVAASVALISDSAWDGSAGRFTPEEWKRSCILHVCDGEEKSCHKLPIKEPGGALSRGGVHAAAGRLNQVQAPAEEKAKAARALRGAYKTLGEDPPDAIKATLDAATFGRGPGWITNPEDTRRLWAYWTQPGHEGYAKINWGTPGDFNRCRVQVGEEIGENSPEDLRFLNQICAQWHHDATGFWPGRAPTEQSLRRLSGGDPAPAVSLVSSAAIKAPADWFKDPQLPGPTHLQVTEDGRVFGHIAEWSSCHIGYEDVCVAPPMSDSNYAYFASKRVLLDDGTEARTGVLSLGGGHAPGHLGFTAAIEHYDRTSSAAADVSVGQDEWGIWCAGWMRPGTTEKDAYDLRASDISGDWREVRPGQMEMVAALAVNVAGFPVVSVHNKAQVALVAAGVVQKHDEDDPMAAVVTAVVAALARRDKMAALRQRVGVN